MEQFMDILLCVFANYYAIQFKKGEKSNVV